MPSQTQARKRCFEVQLLYNCVETAMTYSATVEWNSWRDSRSKLSKFLLVRTGKSQKAFSEVLSFPFCLILYPHITLSPTLNNSSEILFTRVQGHGTCLFFQCIVMKIARSQRVPKGHMCPELHLELARGFVGCI